MAPVDRIVHCPKAAPWPKLSNLDHIGFILLFDQLSWRALNRVQQVLPELCISVISAAKPFYIHDNLISFIKCTTDTGTTRHFTQ
jgi:hypothetical protein